jgi:hypothetical protein
MPLWQSSLATNGKGSVGTDDAASFFSRDRIASASLGMMRTQAIAEQLIALHHWIGSGIEIYNSTTAMEW